MRELSKALEGTTLGDAPHPQDASQTHSGSHPGSQADSSPADFPRDRVLAWLTENVPDIRLQHILRVEAMAVELAQQHQLPVALVAQAGLLHDLAKFFKPVRLLAMARQEGLGIDPVDEANPHLLHAEVGAIVAREEFGITNEIVLNAIRNHTLGRPGMDAVSCAVFLADSLEPGRGDTPELDQLRQASYENLEKAVWLTCDDTIRYLIHTQRLIHPRAIQTRNWFLQAVRSSSPDRIPPPA
jgi:predicted HD superfamily hydrolase involved in NAD metabolism